jgi:uncharacterized protein
MQMDKTLKEKHLDYLKSKGEFYIDCSLTIFNEEERESLEKYGYWFQALQEGSLDPFTDRQRRFIQVANNQEAPFSIEEWAWLKYINRKRIESKYNDRLKAIYVPADDTFYSREMVKQQRKMMFKVTKENHG